MLVQQLYESTMPIEDLARDCASGDIVVTSSIMNRIYAAHQDNWTRDLNTVVIVSFRLRSAFYDALHYSDTRFRDNHMFGSKDMTPQDAVYEVFSNYLEQNPLPSACHNVRIVSSFILDYLGDGGLEPYKTIVRNYILSKEFWTC